MIASGLISLKRESSVYPLETMIASGPISLKRELSVPPSRLKLRAKKKDSSMPTLAHSLAATTRAARTVPVPLGGRSYDVLIGPDLLSEAGRLVAGRLGKARCGIVTDENVAKHHLAALEASLKAEGRHKGSIVLPAGELSALRTVIFQHGLGSDRSNVFSVAEALCAQGWAVLAIDIPFHGMRADVPAWSFASTP